MADKTLVSGYGASQGRRFGLTVGTAFLAISAVLWWRDQPTGTMVTAGIGTLLALGGLLVPAQMGPVDRAWMRLAHVISKVTTPIVMGVMYLLVLFPVGVARRTAGGNPLVHPAQDGSYWKRRAEAGRQSSMRRQF